MMLYWWQVYPSQKVAQSVAKQVEYDLTLKGIMTYANKGARVFRTRQRRFGIKVKL